MNTDEYETLTLFGLDAVRSRRRDDNDNFNFHITLRSAVSETGARVFNDERSARLKDLKATAHAGKDYITLECAEEDFPVLAGMLKSFVQQVNMILIALEKSDQEAKQAKANAEARDRSILADLAKEFGAILAR